jgi:hypothetical protein
MKDEDRCRFFKTMPPLRPGFKPDPKDAGFLKGGSAEEIDPVEKVPTFKELGAHMVYMVYGEEVPANETAVFASMNGAPVCWLTQSDEFLQGSDAIKRVFGDLYIADKDPGPALRRLLDGMRVVSDNYPDLKLAFAYDAGTGPQVEGNCEELMDGFRKASKETTVDA